MDIPIPIIAAVITAGVAVLGVFLTSYLSGRLEVDKKITEARVKLLDDMISAIIEDEPSDKLTRRAAVEIPAIARQWEQYWQQRTEERKHSSEITTRGKEVIKRLKNEMRRPIRGTLRRSYGSLTFGIVALAVIEFYRMLGLAYPHLAEREGYTAFYDLVGPFQFEQDVGNWVRENQILRSLVEQ